MARNREPVLKRARALGIEPAYMGYNKKSNRHPAVSRKKKSEYGIQLNEKQKVKFLYGLSETQFRNTYEKGAKRPGGAGENLLIMLESRFDNVVFRMGFAATRREARQLVNHGHFLVNGQKANIPSMELKDMIITTPEWISLDQDKFEGKILRTPTRQDVDLPIEEHYIVEFYSR